MAVVDPATLTGACVRPRSSRLLCLGRVLASSLPHGMLPLFSSVAANRANEPSCRRYNRSRISVRQFPTGGIGLYRCLTAISAEGTPPGCFHLSKWIGLARGFGFSIRVPSNPVAFRRLYNSELLDGRRLSPPSPLKSAGVCRGFRCAWNRTGTRAGSQTQRACFDEQFTRDFWRIAGHQRSTSRRCSPTFWSPIVATVSKTPLTRTSVSPAIGALRSVRTLISPESSRIE